MNETPNQPDYKRITDALIESGQAVPFRTAKWEDFPLEARLQALRILLAKVVKRKAAAA